MSNNKSTQFNQSKSVMTGGPRHGSGMSMAATMDKPKDFKNTLKRLLKYFGKYLPAIIAAAVIAAIATVFTVLAPKILGTAITSIEQTVESRIGGTQVPINYSLILRVSIILGGLYTLSAVLLVFQRRLMAKVSQNIVKSMRSQVQQKLTRLPLSFFDKVTHGEILSRAVGDVENIAVNLQENIIQLITGVITLIGVLIMLLTINWMLTLVVLVTIPLYFFIAKPLIKRAQKLLRIRQKANGELNGLIEEMYSGLKVVKAYGKESETKKSFADINNSYCESGWKSQYIAGTIMPLMGFLANFTYVLTCVSSGIMFAMNIITLGDVAAFLLYVKQFSGPINQITGIINSIQASIASAERIFELLDETEEIDSMTKTPEFKNGEVIFENISFRYTPDKPLIENLTLQVNDGETIAIVGPTGAGKTTLVNLLMRFYDVNAGEIYISGIKSSECTRSDIRQQFGMVLQDTWLFNGTIMGNIRYGKEGATDKQCIEAAKKVQAHHFISTLPDGYDTILNEEASNISQGEKQLITIARTLLHDPRILILDEATSNVDTLTELRIQNGMNEIMRNRTCFIIAHRLSTIKNANKILVMINGNIVETGTHSSLLAQNGAYAELYKSQFALL